MSGYRDDSPHGGLIPTHELQRRNAEVAYEEKITRLRAENERLTEELSIRKSVFPDIAPERVLPDRSKLEAENERLREALRKGGEAVERLAFEMPPPNEWTPQFVALGQAITRAAMEEKRE